jgi:hypothetical protein
LLTSKVSRRRDRVNPHEQFRHNKECRPYARQGEGHIVIPRQKSVATDVKGAGALSEQDYHDRALLFAQAKSARVLDHHSFGSRLPSSGDRRGLWSP